MGKMDNRLWKLSLSWEERKVSSRYKHTMAHFYTVERKYGLRL